MRQRQIQSSTTRLYAEREQQYSSTIADTARSFCYERTEPSQSPIRNQAEQATNHKIKKKRKRTQSPPPGPATRSQHQDHQYPYITEHVPLQGQSSSLARLDPSPTTKSGPHYVDPTRTNSDRLKQTNKANKGSPLPKFYKA